MEIVEIFSVIALLGSVIALLFSSLALRRAETKRLRDAEALVHGLQADVVNLTDVYQRLYSSVHKMRTRIGRDAARAKKVNDDDLPDPTTHPTEWQQEMMRRHPRGALDMMEKK